MFFCFLTPIKDNIEERVAVELKFQYSNDFLRFQKYEHLIKKWKQFNDRSKTKIRTTTLEYCKHSEREDSDADDFRDYILGFIFYKYLSRKMEMYANVILQPDGLTYHKLKGHENEEEFLEAIKGESLDKLGYFLKPEEMFGELVKRGNGNGKSKFILGDLAKVLTNIEQSTMGSESEDDFGNLFRRSGSYQQ